MLGSDFELAQYARAEELERFLGDPLEDKNVFSFARAVKLDEREEYPEEAGRLLNEWGFHYYFIPEEYGGKLRSLEELVLLIRVIARRDPTVAYSNLITFLGTISGWVAGTEEQKRRLVKIIKNNGRLALGFTEKEHGNDTMAYEVMATRVEDGYLLSGEKWPVSQGTCGQALTILARTDERGGLRGFSLFLVEKDRVDKSSYKYLPKLKTHGIRGADVSGIRFEGCLLPQDALIGAPGAGIELFLKFSQVTRTIVPAVSLGAADTALRATMNFALTRRLYGDTVFAIPHARMTLVDAFLDLLVCECLNIATVRSAHVTTEQMSIPAAVNKYYVPATVESLISKLSIVLGARYYLREGHWSGIFQKIVRDSAIISIGHVTRIYNLKAVAQQFRDIVNHRENMKGDQNHVIRANLESVFSLEKPLPAFDPGRLALLNRGRDDITQGLKLSLERIHSLRNDLSVEPDVLEAILSLTSELLEDIHGQAEIWIDLERQYGHEFNESPQMYELAKRRCALHAASACVHMWAHNRGSLGEFFTKGEWLALCLERLLAGLRPAHRLRREEYLENVARELERLHKEGRMFSIVPLQLAQGRESEVASRSGQIEESSRRE